jgi:hypothetical protein
MGMPFPTGLRAVADQSVTEYPALEVETGSLVEWAWAMNAASSVLGSVAAIFLAIRFGLNITLAAGAAAYFLALGLAATLRPSSKAA